MRTSDHSPVIATYGRSSLLRVLHSLRNSCPQQLFPRASPSTNKATLYRRERTRPANARRRVPEAQAAPRQPRSPLGQPPAWRPPRHVALPRPSAALTSPPPCSRGALGGERGIGPEDSRPHTGKRIVSLTRTPLDP